MGIERMDDLKMRQALKTIQQSNGYPVKAAKAFVVARQEGDSLRQ
jgi:hypothetical protein